MLFILFLYDIRKIKLQHINIALYADDIIVWVSHNNLNTACTILNRCLKELHSYAKDHKMIINTSPGKSEYAFFTVDKHQRKKRFSVKIGDTELSFTNAPKYLGVILDPELCYGKHIDQVVAKARKRLNILKSIAGKAWGANSNTLRTSYNAIVKPILEYAISAWSHSAKSNIEKVDRVHRSAARIITGVMRSCPNDIALLEADLLPLSLERDLKRKRYVQKLKSYSHHHRTAEFVKTWHPTNRIKKRSLLHDLQNNAVLHTSLAPTQAPFKSPMTKPIECEYHENTIDPILKKADLDELALHVRALETLSRIPKSDSVIYTDGSTSEDLSSGSGVHACLANGNKTNIAIHNSKYTSNYAAELTAIKFGLLYIERNPILVNSDIWILTDNRGTIQDLQSPINNSKMVDDIRIIVGKIPNKIIYQWIPSHCGIPGNDKADSLAKQGASNEGDVLLKF